MLTLTFRRTHDFDTTNFDECRNKFTLFWKSLKRCKRLAEVDLRYVGAIEFQKNGNFDFHILCHIPETFKSLLKTKWKYGGLHFERAIGSEHNPKAKVVYLSSEKFTNEFINSIRAEDTQKIASYLTKGIHDERLPLGKKRFLGGHGLEKPVVLKFSSRKIIDYLMQRNGKVLTTYASKYGFTFTSLLSNTTINELERFAVAEDEDLDLSLLEKLQSIQFTYTNEGVI